MENKLISIILKGGMAVLFAIGLYLIWTNISIAPRVDEDLELTDQSFYTVKFEDENGKEDKIVYYSYVLDAEAGEVYDLDNNAVYEYDEFMSSNGEEKNKVGEIEKGMVHNLLLKYYDFQSATTSSISYTRWLMIIAGIAILIFTLINIVVEPKRFIRSAIGVVALIVIAFICYKMAPEVGTGKMLETANYTDTSFHYTGMGLLTTGVLILISCGLIAIQAVVSLTRIFSK